MSKFILIFLSSCLLSITAFAQNPVAWSFDAKAIADDEYELTFTADVQDGWYIYSQYLDEGGPVPTAFYVNEENGLTVLGKPQESGNRKAGYDEIFEMELVKFSGTVLFKQKVKTSNVDAVKGYLEYMTCNDEQCLPPTEVEFTISLK
ncbi:MAG: protein-disulfide reductase DsbD domain-containing protein [Bacteroidota bacterium]